MKESRPWLGKRAAFQADATVSLYVQGVMLEHEASRMGLEKKARDQSPLLSLAYNGLSSGREYLEGFDQDVLDRNS